MALTYYEVADWFDASGTLDGVQIYKEVTVTASSGDLLVAVGFGENAEATTRGTVSTTSGTTSAWTQVGPQNAALGSSYGGGWATVTTGGSITVRVAVSGTDTHYSGMCVWKFPAADWTGTPAVTNVASGNATGVLQDVTIGATSTVLMGMGDWSALNPSTGSTPAGGTNHYTYGDGAHYGIVIRSWTGQTAGTRDYGLDADPGDADYIGVLVAVEEAGGTPATVTPSTVAATTSVTEYTERNALITLGGASKQGVWA